MDKKFDVVGIGNAIVDVLAEVEDDFLTSRSLEKGSMKLIDEEDAKILHNSINVVEHLSGGSAANTIAGLAMLGDNVAFIGKVKSDQLGQIFEEGLNCIGVKCKSSKIAIGLPTARCIILVTPDSQRTMCTYLGTSGSLSPDDIDEDIIRNAKIIYFEGYLWDRPEAKEAINKAIAIAKKFGNKIAFSLSDGFCVDRHREEFFHIIQNYSDIIFANEIEINSLFNTSNRNESIKQCKNMKKIFAITMAEKGSMIINGSEVIKVDAFVVEKPMDSTGAGDMYAAGFLHGFIKGKELKKCGEIGSMISSEIIMHFGARPKKEIIEKIKNKIDI
jgi:sugar/nucleoside kinase (ribokinase family)